MTELNLSHYRPTPESRRFSISSLAVVGQIEWRAKPAGEFEARIEVIKGALAKMIPFQSMEASVRVVADGSISTKIYSSRTIGGKNGTEVKEKSWTDLSVISAIEIPWVAEYALQRRNAGGPSDVYFEFEDNQRVRTVTLRFSDDPEGNLEDAIATLRVLKPDEQPDARDSKADSEVKSRGKVISLASAPRAGDVLVTFRNGKLFGFTVSVPVVGKLRFVSQDLK